MHLNGVSANLSAGWATFAGKTYAQVLQMQSKRNLKPKVYSPPSQEKVYVSSSFHMSSNKHIEVKSPVCSPTQKRIDKCTKNVRKSESKRKSVYEEKPHFTCVTKNRFKSLSPSETFCTKNDSDLIEDFNCSLDKQDPDTTPKWYSLLAKLGY